MSWQVKKVNALIGKSCVFQQRPSIKYAEECDKCHEVKPVLYDTGALFTHVSNAGRPPLRPSLFRNRLTVSYGLTDLVLRFC